MPPTARTPRDPAPDSTLALASDGYEFIRKRAQRYDSDVFETRLMLQRHLCMTGSDAAKLFYDESRFIRRGAAPRRVKATLLGFGGVQGLDDERHRVRKRLFMSQMTPERIADLVERSARGWRHRQDRWSPGSRVVLYEEAKEILAGAVCAWAGLPLQPDEIPVRTGQLAALFESAAAVGPWHWKGRLARHRAENWLVERIEAVRLGALPARPGSALEAVAQHRDADGEQLPARVAAVELLNLLRPTVAVAVYVAFIAVALHDHPRYRERLAARDEDLTEQFVQEVRRFYPFFPFQGARVRTAFEWRGHRFDAGRKVLLDLYGTNHDPRIWTDPEQFRPERFADRPIDPFELIPQGGGDHHSQHRCAGEWLTIGLMKSTVHLLVSGISYEVPAQDLTIRMNRMPAVPESGFVLVPQG